MKLSDAIALGRTLLRPRAYTTIVGDEGCALGMAMAALGAKNHEEALKVCGNSGWSWPKNKIAGPLPCGCTDDGAAARWKRESKAGSYHAAIVHLFNEHVCGKQNWTLDQLIDWVRSVEPAEPESQLPTNGFAATPDSSVGSIGATDEQFERMELDWRDAEANTR